jgi:hypothetical protein
MTTLIRLIAIVMALALTPRLRTEFHLRALRVQALMGPRPAYLTHRFVDNLIAAHRATFGTAVMAALELWDAVLPSDLTRFSREVPIPQEYGALAGCCRTRRSTRSRRGSAP